MDESRQQPRKTPAQVVVDEIGYGLRFLRKHGWRLALWFSCLLLPVWGFAALVGELHEKEVFTFDAPILHFLHTLSTPSLDRFFVMVSRIGFLWGVIPLDVILVAWLAARRRFRDGLFAGLALAGSAILDVAGKNFFRRARPDLWLSITPEYTYSFPSGHAMGSATLGITLILLAWPTRWRWPVAMIAILFVALVGISRVYLGVHYPSDILAGWCAATAWVVGMYLLVSRKSPAPPATAKRSADTTAPPGAASKH